MGLGVETRWWGYLDAMYDRSPQVFTMLHCNGTNAYVAL